MTNLLRIDREVQMRMAYGRCAAATILLLWSGPLSGQQVSGRVVESEVLVPIAGASVVALDTTFTVVQQTHAGEDGTFRFTGLPYGVYLLQAIVEGRAGLISTPVTVDGEPKTIILVVPSVAYELAMYCPSSSGSVLVGIVYEESGVPLPGARVAVYWPTLGDSIVATTDAVGLYRFCSVPVLTTLSIGVATLGRTLSTTLRLADERIIRADFELGLGIGGSTLRIARSTPLENAQAAGILSGVLRDRDTGVPIAGAIVRLQERDEPAVTSDDGVFRFIGLNDGKHLLGAEHIAYGTQREVVTLERGMHIEVDFQLAATAIALERIEAIGNSREIWDRRASPERMDMISGLELAREEARGAGIASVVATRFPSLKVSEGRFVSRYGISRGVCMESNRRIMSLSAAATGDGNAVGRGDIRSCNTIEVVVDDVRVSDPVGFLGTVNLTDFESISFMSAVNAGIRYGRNAGEYGGVLLLWTRGRGPYTSQARNTPPE